MTDFTWMKRRGGADVEVEAPERIALRTSPQAHAQRALVAGSPRRSAHEAPRRERPELSLATVITRVALRISHAKAAVKAAWGPNDS